jgi:hypothetical protein
MIDLTPDQTLAGAGGKVVVLETPWRRDDNIAMAGLADFLDIHTWSTRDIPEPDRLLGDLVTTDSRVFLVGSTGLGKTMLGFALAQGMAAGSGFLHWRATRAVRVLYIDGEMASGLVKARSIAELRRGEATPKPGMLSIYSQDFAEQIAAAFPSLGRMPPLNKPEGHDWVKALVAAIEDVEVVIFDNVMSLLVGDMKEEQPWNDTLPLVAALSAKRIGQIWIDHTGHDTARQYGSSTKAWRFDAVGIMSQLPESQRGQAELEFQLSFDHPGKARRRTPENWSDFAPVVVRLVDGRWTGEQTAKGRPMKAAVSPAALAMHRALLDALAISATPGETTRDEWYAEASRLGLLDPMHESDGRDAKGRKRAKLRKSLAELKVAGWIGVDGETVRNLLTEGR